ncbi:ankyrin repeat domain-containing protein [Mesorhizobium amorphae]|uniref:ankyrin repeat domain-containing protein n=1 Tax=Mesorhizobium amorphae TaxID=71433 RepID=UPI003F4F70FC
MASALDKGAAINEIDGVTALYIACEIGNAELAKLLINRGADVNLPVSWQHHSTPPTRVGTPTS